ncbi:natural killer cells antigen CD94-like isoform X10 [Ctenopharyngodon idella]|uniref:natural killer cells antigen CD94-like isoform X10 n=1 Tax=Ctenopharyngodon idella TaxID=7959 RepID=UPI0022313747|nr:natural killer cells antigen CD94-like isoform X10 [Ctenopharyngodon idella]
MEFDTIYENVNQKVIKDTSGPQIHSQDEGQAQKQRGSRCLVLMTVCLGIICVLLLVSIILQHISITAERESLFKSNKNTAEEFNQTINRLQHNYTDLTQKKLELESKVTSLSEELKKAASKQSVFSISSELKSWSESRQYCRDRGADLVIINTEEKQRLISSFKERVWIGLTDIENEGNMKWVDNSPLKQGMKRQTFQMKDNPLLTSKTVLLKSIRHYFDSTFNLTEQMKVLPAEVTECCIVTTDEDKNGHSYVKLDEDIVKRSCDKAAFKYYSF